ncbi:DUF1223 domain-containing protein [Antarcticimicrobium luteum]|uniref:DUF1223 domain-containing protein n=1 Tax=Antarcticimicrobium luteum TaxID=2547397 RepID=A0A4R5VH79_9RHOB|nr:DUF1223 domain-containing protein [Antarcticimicrobium luteum]TDK51273.1 DUF1223 domain-containing protein [Antarcticimicrobium luteum]
MKRVTAISTAILAAFWTAFAAPAAAQERGPVVVELFTSQGCSSCPPADALLRELAEREDVLPLALHVEYWDYIGWKDSFADPANTTRQKGYARAAGRDMIYTPQMVVMGQEDVVGARSMKLAELIMHHMQAPALVLLSAGRDGAEVRISLRPASAPVEGPLDVHLVRYAPLRHVEVTRGENAGQSLDYANVVDAWQTLGQWDGQGPLTLTFEAPAEAGARDAILVQRAGFGPILAAARLR